MMNKTKQEMSKNEKAQDKLEIKAKKIRADRDKIMDKFNKKIGIIEDKQYKLSSRNYDLRDRLRQRCKHKKEFGRKEWANCRDDASFSTYVACKKCGETLWNECYGPRGGY